MLNKLNEIFLAAVLLIALIAMAISVIIIFLPFLPGSNAEFEATSSMHTRTDFFLPKSTLPLSSYDSPKTITLRIHTPALKADDTLFVDIYSGGRQVAHIDCLEKLEGNQIGTTSLACEIPIPYNYDQSGNYHLFGILTSNNTDYSAGPVTADVDWGAYEENFWVFSWFIVAVLLASYVIVLIPVGLFVWSVAWRTKHGNIDPEEYSLRSLFFLNGKSLIQRFHSFLISPYFWALELTGIFIIVLYMAFTAQIWKSSSALAAFLFSGLLAFIVPYLWCAAWWYADYREREPLRLMFSFFLWGMLAALMAIGLNSIAGALFGLVGLGFVSTFLLAPPLEELFKGSGLALLSEHHEYDSIEDGIVFGFTVGMGFAFIENWVYLLDNPMGSDIGGWLFIFFLRAIIFSANHGFFTAITGIVIGYLIERQFKAPALGLLVGVPLAAFFHAMHNSGETIIALLGGGGTIIYCCFLIPLFDYGGFIILVLFFIRSVMRKKVR
jgi:RsiW-degrading membrane proteinase PrsW (M82 family)